MNQVKKFIRKNPLAFAGILIWIVFIIFALFAPVIATCDPLAQDLTSRNMGPNAAHFFGTDADEVLMRFADMVMSFPGILLAMALASIMGKSMMNAVLAIALVSWPKYARMMRSMVLVVRESEYVTSERAIGQSRLHILMHTVIPNCLSSQLVLASTDVGTAILTFAGLSFLGMGVIPPTPEWGYMVSDGVGILKYWWISFFPGLSIFLVSIAANFIGDAIRDILDPRMRTQS